MDFPVLHTSRLSLVKITAAHTSGLFHLFTDPRVTEYYNVRPFKEEADTLQVISWFDQIYHEQTGIRWSITLHGQKDFIGTIGFNTYTRGHRGVLVYALNPTYWGQGFVTEALREIITYGFVQLELNRIEAEVMPGNTPSERVLAKIGFSHEGLLRQWMLWMGRYNDINMYSLLKSEYMLP